MPRDPSLGGTRKVGHRSEAIHTDRNRRKQTDTRQRTDRNRRVDRKSDTVNTFKQQRSHLGHASSAPKIDESTCGTRRRPIETGAAVTTRPIETDGAEPENT